MRLLLRYIGILAIVGCVSAAAAAPGKFYIVGMGTAPDLITLRGVEAIKSADLILLEQPSEFEYWKDFIGNKEVFYCPHGARVGLGLDPGEVSDPDIRAIVEQNDKHRKEAVARIKKEVEAGKIVAALEGGDPMIYGTTFYLEMLPKDFPAEIVPGIGAFQSVSAAVKKSPVFGYDTNAVIVTMDDWPGRRDVNKKLMATKSSMIYLFHGPQLSAALRAADRSTIRRPRRLRSYPSGVTRKAAGRAKHGRALSDRGGLQKTSRRRPHASCRQIPRSRAGACRRPARSQKADRTGPRSDADSQVAVSPGFCSELPECE